MVDLGVGGDDESRPFVVLAGVEGRKGGAVMLAEVATGFLGDEGEGGGVDEFARDHGGSAEFTAEHAVEVGDGDRVAIIAVNVDDLVAIAEFGGEFAHLAPEIDDVFGVGDSEGLAVVEGLLQAALESAFAA